MVLLVKLAPSPDGIGAASSSISDDQLAARNVELVVEPDVIGGSKKTVRTLAGRIADDGRVHRTEILVVRIGSRFRAGRSNVFLVSGDQIMPLNDNNSDRAEDEHETESGKRNEDGKSQSAAKSTGL